MTRPNSTDREALATVYAELRHPALVPVRRDGDWVCPAPTTGTPVRPPLAVTTALRATGEVALGLAALHRAGLAHGGVDAAELLEDDGGYLLAGVAKPASPGDERADLTALASLLAELTAPATAPDQAAIEVLTTGAEELDAAAWGRAALAQAREPERDPRPAAPPEATATERPSRLSDDRETAMRRTRNRMIVGGAVVVIAGAVVLRAIDNAGSVQVPNVVGESRVTAVHDLTAAGLDPVVHVVASAAGSANAVIRETPSAGERVRPGRTVTLVVVGPS